MSSKSPRFTNSVQYVIDPTTSKAVAVHGAETEELGGISFNGLIVWDSVNNDYNKFQSYAIDKASFASTVKALPVISSLAAYNDDEGETALLISNPIDVGLGETEVALSVRAANFLYDPYYGFSLEESNRVQTILASAARTASVDSGELANNSLKGGHFIVNVSAISGASLVVKIQGLDASGGNAYDILESAAITTTGTTVLKIYPGIGAVANGAASDVLPQFYKVIVTAADANSATYSIKANLVR